MQDSISFEEWFDDEAFLSVEVSYICSIGLCGAVDLLSDHALTFCNNSCLHIEQFFNVVFLVAVID